MIRIGRPPRAPRRWHHHALDWATATGDALLLVALVLIVIGG